MEPTLNKSRLAAVIGLVSAMCSIPVMYAMHQAVPMQGWQDYLINWLMALFISLAAAGAILHLALFAFGGTLPKWFWTEV